MASNSSDQMRFNVGGKIFETTATTLAVAGPDSFFGPLVNGNWNVQPKQQDAIFIDRDPKCFSVILNLLRTGELHVPPNVPKDLLLKEAQFYGVLDHVRAATWGPFDANRLSLLRSVPIPIASYDHPQGLVRASPTGGCCVAHGRTIRVYDWMLREHSPIILDYEYAKDIVWMDSKNIIVTAPKSIRLFNLSTGEQTLEFYVTEDVVKPEYSFCALCVDNDGKIYSGCYGKGIGVWDPQRSEPIDFINNHDLYKVDKLQWLPERRCLLVGSYIPRVDTGGFRFGYDHFPNYCLTLLDLRQKKSVIYRPGSDADRNTVLFQDMVGMESTNTIVTVDEDERLSFIDLRFNSSDFQLRRRKDDQSVKLIEHNGQLFSSRYDHISVYSLGGHRLSWLKSKSEITDLSIASDRLFFLSDGGASLDVWGTSPCSPIL